MPADELNHWRNRIAVPIANWVLNHIATPGYRLRVRVLIREGMCHVYGTPSPFGEEGTNHANG